VYNCINMVLAVESGDTGQLGQNWRVDCESARVRKLS
jgi:hypothetical protein